jgi:hypothetical protein
MSLNENNGYDLLVLQLVNELKKSRTYYMNRQDSIMFFIYDYTLYGIKNLLYDEFEYLVIGNLDFPLSETFLVWKEECKFKLQDIDNPIKKYELVKTKPTDYEYLDYDGVVDIFAKINLMNNLKDVEL